MQKALKFFLLPAIAILAMFAACNKESDTLTTDEAVDYSLYSVQDRGGMGRLGCFELVFPVTFNLPDGTPTTVNSYDELKTALRTYFQANGGGTRPNGTRPFGGRPKIDFVYPIQVISKDGEVIDVADEAALLALRVECAGTFGNHGWQGHGNGPLSCFEFIFPITVEFPDGSTQSIADRAALRLAIRTWHQANPGATERPHLTFPITVKMTDDGTEVVVNSREELRALKEGCN